MALTRKLRDVLAGGIAGTLCAGLGGGLALGATPATAAPLPAAPIAQRGEPVNVMSWNIAGGKVNRGRVEPIVPAIARAVSGRGLTAAVLNEACAPQVRALRERLPQFTVHYFRAEADRCRGGIGNVVIAPRGSKRLPAFSRTLPSGDSFVRNVGCVQLPDLRKVAVCGTHHSFEADLARVRQRQAEITTDLVQGLVRRGFAVVAGGDLNATPRSRQLDQFYSRAYPGGRGVLRESNGCCARRGPGTTKGGGKKIDYLFFSRGLRRVDGAVRRTSVSDHRQVVIRTRLTR